MFSNFNFRSACPHRIDCITKTMSKFMFMKIAKLYSIPFSKSFTPGVVIDLVFLIPTSSLFHSSMQYGKNVLLKDFVLVGTSLMIEVDDNLNR